MRSIEQQSSEERKETFRSLLQDVVLPQRYRLLRSRDHTWQSAYVDDDGYLAELIASIVLGTPGTRRRGVSRSFGDLADGTEVKKGYRADPNIDFLLEVEKKGEHIILRAVPPELELAGIRCQINANSCSVQKVEKVGGNLFGGLYCRTVGRNALAWDPTTGQPRLRLMRGSVLLSQGEHLICVRQERGHINFGNKTRGQLDQIIASKPVLVFYQHDISGAFSVAVTRIEMSDAERTMYLDQLFADRLDRKQIQPYLFPDNVRTSLYSRGPHSIADGLQGRLLAYAVESSDGADIVHWSPTDAPMVRDCAGILTAELPRDRRPPFRHAPLDLRWDDLGARREFASEFFASAIAGYSRALQPYCDACGVTRNLGLGNQSQHLASAVTGLRGTRSGARGGDLVERDGVTLSDVKLATGQRGDSLGTEDMPRLTLGWGHEKMLSWKRLIPVRAVELNTPHGHRWHMLVHAPTRECMETFASQVRSYFEGRVNNGSGGLQYHTSEFPHHHYGTVDRTLRFECLATFAEGEAANFSCEMPDW